MNAGFDTTQWSIVVAAARSGEGPAQQALAALCERYWQPLYVFARRSGASAVDAEDLTQAFFAHLIEKRSLRSARRERGRFRSFLLVAFKHFTADQRDRDRALKRGGGLRRVSFDPLLAETTLPSTLVDGATPEAIFERRWALAVLDAALADLRRGADQDGTAPLFEALQDTLVGSSERSYSAIGASLGMTEGAVKVAAHRLRRRFRTALRAEVARLVDLEEVDAELRYLLKALS